MKPRFRYLNVITNIALILVIFLFGCSPSEIVVQLKESTSHTPSGKFLAGASKIDITPPPGYAQGGNSVEAKTSKGFWHRLYSRAIYMEDSTGAPFFLVSVELWSVSAGFTNKVVEIVQDSLPFIGRENVLIAATHTHQSPGNFSSWSYYNYFAQNTAGYDEKLFSFLTAKVAQSMLAAYRARTNSYLAVSSSVMHHVVRNRSVDAFMQNPGSSEFIQERMKIPEGPTSPLFPTPSAYRAVEPAVHVIALHNAESDALIAKAGFFAMHPNSLGSFPDFYNGGVFGAVSLLLESDSSDAKVPVAAMFNGAEGDVSPVFEKQGMMTTIKLAAMLADTMSKKPLAPEVLRSPIITSRFQEFPLSGVSFQDRNQQTVTTAQLPLPGDPVMGGAEDGRAGAGCLLFCEGLKSNAALPIDQRPKSHLVSSALKFLFPDFFEKGLPKKVPLGLHEVGPIVFCTFPGEFTTMLGYNIKRSLAEKLKTDRLPIPVGLANEYLSYFTTPEEYDAQHYEGASTLYGKPSGLLIEQSLVSLSEQPANKKFSGMFTYYPGELPSKGINEILEISRNEHPEIKSQWSGCYCKNEHETENRSDTTLYWDDDLPSLSLEKQTMPSVRVERALHATQNWNVIETDENQNMVVTRTSTAWHYLSSTWKVVYYHPVYEKEYHYRLVVKKINGDEEYFDLR